MNEYLEEYVAAMREDKKLIVSAASHASKALAYLQVLATNQIDEAA
jgi:antirestriction protein ArdC